MQKEIKKGLLILLGSVGLTLLVIEIILRFLFFGTFGDRFFSPEGDTYWERHFLLRHASGEFVYAGLHQPHPQRGWSPIPGCNRQVGQDTYSINEKGYRSSRAHTPNPDQYRVLVIGDSFTFGVDADNSETWPQQLANLDPRFFVINQGVGGYGLGQMLITLTETIREYRPQLVIFAYIDDDLRRSLLNFRDYQKPRFCLIDGELVLASGVIGEREWTYNRLKKKYGWTYPMLGHFLKELIFKTQLKRDSYSLELFQLNQKIVEAALALTESEGADFLLVHLAHHDAIRDPDIPDLGESFFYYFLAQKQCPSLETRKEFLKSPKNWERYHYQRPEAELVSGLIYAQIKKIPSWQEFVKGKRN